MASPTNRHENGGFSATVGGNSKSAAWTRRRIAGYVARVSRPAIHNRRLTFFIPGTNPGGAQLVMFDLANGFAVRGYDVDIVIAIGSNNSAFSTEDTVRVVFLNKRSARGAIPAFARYLRRVNPGAVISALTHGNIACLIARKLSCREMPVVVAEHNPLERTLARFSGPRLLFNRLLIKFLYAQAQAVVAVH